MFQCTLCLLLDQCRIALKNNYLEQSNLSKKSEIRDLRHTTINLLDKYGKPLYFIKKQGSGFNSYISLKKEVWFYNYISQRKELFKVKEFVPNFFAYENKYKMLILENLYNYEPLYSYVERLNAFPKDIIEHLARNIAYLHATTNFLFYKEDKDIPYSYFNIPSFDKITPEILANSNDAIIEMLEIIQSDDRINKSLNSLRKFAKYCLIHGDLKFDNILISKYTNKISLKFIDWELCGWGNPHIDLGTIIGNYLLLWAKSIQLRKNQSLKNSIKNSKITFMELTLAINYFLKRYKEYIKSYSPCFPSISTTDIIKYAGLVILSSVYSEVKLSYRLTSKGVLILSLSKTLLIEPNHVINILNVE